MFEEKYDINVPTFKFSNERLSKLIQPEEAIKVKKWKLPKFNKTNFNSFKQIN